MDTISAKLREWIEGKHINAADLFSMSPGPYTKALCTGFSLALAMMTDEIDRLVRLSDHASPVTPQEQNTTQENEVPKKEGQAQAGPG